MGKLDRFDAHVPAEPWVNPWQADGSFEVDLALLARLLGVAEGTSQRSGVVAGAVDIWAAEELRRAGMHPDDVWPRRTDPRIMPRDVRKFVEHGLTVGLREQVQQRYSSPGARRALPTDARVMGSAYSKQADVVVASWAAGLELMISTKTMLSSYAKNLRNRFEEAYGDAKNLRGRHPLAALGFLFVMGADAEESELDFAIDMMTKLTSEPDVYDTACLLVVDTAAKEDEEVAAEEPDELDEPAALDSIPELDLSINAEDDAGEDDAPDAVDVQPVQVLAGRVPDHLAASQFFATLLGKALHHMPTGVYPEVRARRRSPQGDSGHPQS
ncbi:hypothetical protein [Salsipaludibacter albus]|uniref:hypothetical protein n=1 Tax=Salsipaludibacter albus TaxID=2849650 RepID=UPI001EE4979D|nr:hypothetical protein [Salsipaludibacter albus]MBY5163447.1 hypothetical protein [Salsipaludibacter albus]